MSKRKKENIDKMDKLLLLEQQKRLKKDHCMKYLKIIIDENIINANYGEDIKACLMKHNMQIVIEQQFVSGVITWQREQQQFLTNESNMTDKYKNENYLLCIKNAEEFINILKCGDIINSIKTIQNVYPEKRLTLIIFGIKNYCTNNKNIINEKIVEYKLTELQIETNCSHRFLETKEELALFVSQFSRSIGEAPLKAQRDKVYDDSGCCIANDNRDTVHVDGKNGLSKLWQQHLIKLPSVTLEVAEAIIKHYPTPKSLFEAFETNSNAVNLLSDIPIKRSNVPQITNDRKIGPILSKKIYTLYTCKNPNEII